MNEEPTEPQKPPAEAAPEALREVAREELLAECLDDYHRRAALREFPSPESYAQRLGDMQEEFCALIHAGELLDPPRESLAIEVLPRPFGAYTLLRRMGQGAVGVVYDAVHRDLGRRVALKVLHKVHADDLESRERFRREAPACARVRHDHIIPIYEAGSVDGELFYAMALIEGASLDDLIKAKTCPPARELALQLADIADALQLLHDAGIVHRDVKPANLIMDAQGRLVLGDFGLARTGDARRLTQTGRAVGTPLYMSPEQISASRGEEGVDGRSDIYALGATLYEALTGQPPFSGLDLLDLLKRKLGERPERMCKLVPGIPAALDDIVSVCLERDRDDRYATAADLARDLRAFARGDGLAYRPVSWWRRAARAVLERPGRVASAAVLMLAGGALWAGLSRPTLATLELESVLGAQVSVNEEAFEAVPYVARREPGEVRLVLRLDGHKDNVINPFYVEAGERYHRSYLGFSVADADDAAAIARTAEARGWSNPLPVVPEASIGRSRARRAFDVLLLYPQGTVRAQDLGHYRVEMGEDYAEAGRVEFRRAGELLYQSERILSRETDGVVPASVLAVLKPGDVIEWGYRPEEGEAFLTTVTVAAADLEESLAALDSQLDDPQAPQLPAVRAWFRAQHLLAAGLPGAAVAELERARDGGIVSLSLLALETRLLRQLHAGAARHLESTVLWRSLESAHEELLREREAR